MALCRTIHLLYETPLPDTRTRAAKVPLQRPSLKPAQALPRQLALHEGAEACIKLFQSKVNNEVGPGGRELGVVPAKPAEAFCRAVAQSKVTEDPAIAVSSTFPPCADSPCSSAGATLRRASPCLLAVIVNSLGSSGRPELKTARCLERVCQCTE